MDRTNEFILAAFASALQDSRRAAALTQEALADRAGISARFVSYLETRKRQPTLEILVALSSGLGMSLSAFSAEIENRMVHGDGQAGEGHR